MSVIPYGLISVQRITSSIANKRVYLFYIGQKKAKRITRIDRLPSGNYRVFYETSTGGIKTRNVLGNHLILTAFYDVTGECCDNLVKNAESVGDLGHLSALLYDNPHASILGANVGYLCG